MSGGAAPGRALIGLGSNTDGRRELARARGALAAELRVLRVTRPRPSPPEGGGTGEYWNQLVLVEAPEAAELGALCKRIERELGRTREADGRVSIDLDLLRTGEFEAEEIRRRRYWRPHLDELGA